MPFDFQNPGGAQGYVVVGGRAWQVVVRFAPGGRLAWWMELNAATMGEDLPPDQWVRDLRAEPAGSLRREDSPPTWGTFARGRAPAANAGADHAFGWPLPALWYRVNGTIGGKTATATGIDGAILLSPASTLSIRGGRFRALPLYPVWHGLVLNTLLFAGLLWLTLTGLPSARRALRIRRGRCPKCAYDLRGLAPGSPCPECGRGATA
jgi:hypothetical protein